MTDETSRLRALAPAAAEWPRWWRRNFTPSALYTIGTVILGAVITVTMFVVSHHNDSSDLSALKESNQRIEVAIGVLQSQIADVKKWQSDRDELDRKLMLLQNPYVKSHPQLRQREPQK